MAKLKEMEYFKFFFTFLSNMYYEISATDLITRAYLLCLNHTPRVSECFIPEEYSARTSNVEDKFKPLASLSYNCVEFGCLR